MRCVKSMLNGLCLGMLVMIGFSFSAHADYVTNMVAQWTFNSINPSGLTADSGNYTLTSVAAGGSGNTINYNADGSVSLGSGWLLYTTEVNSASMPKLKEQFTVVARMKIDAAPGGNYHLFSLLMNKGTLTHAASSAGQNNSASFQCFSSNGEVSMDIYLSDGSKGALQPRKNTMSVGQYYTVAIVYVSTGSTVTYFNIVNGSVVSTTMKTSQTLQDFSAFGLGRCRESGGVAATYDEVRIYDAALTPEQIAQIEFSTPRK